ncbi:MAG: hypothetical protein ACLTYW_00210 [Collinsella sp.]
MVECCCDYGICEVEFDRAYAEEFGTGDSENSSFGAMWALEWIPNHMRDMQEAACETFESYRAGPLAAALLAAWAWTVRALAAGLLLLAFMAL